METPTPARLNDDELHALNRVRWTDYEESPKRAFRDVQALLGERRLLLAENARLREEQAHRRLGFAAEQVTGWLADAGLGMVATRHLAPADESGHQLTVTLWLAASAAEPTLASEAERAVA